MGGVVVGPQIRWHLPCISFSLVFFFILRKCIRSGLVSAGVVWIGRPWTGRPKLFIEALSEAIDARGVADGCHIFEVLVGGFFSGGSHALFLLFKNRSDATLQLLLDITLLVLFFLVCFFCLGENGVGEARLDLGNLVLLAAFFFELLHLKSQPIVLYLCLLKLGAPVPLILGALEVLALHIDYFSLLLADFVFEALDFGLVLAFLEVPLSLDLALSVLNQLLLLLFQFLKFLHDVL